MKYILLIIVIINFTSSLNTTKSVNDNTAEIVLPLYVEEQVSVAEEYYDRLEVNTNLPKRINLFLSKMALERPEVPEAVWVEIKNSVNYANFKVQILEIIPDYYTDSEMQTILDAHANRPHVPMTKLTFRKQLMMLARKFVTTDFITTANTILSDNGYSLLDL